MCYQECVFIGSLPSTEHCAEHIENMFLLLEMRVYNSVA
jgi:hypothetical protein